MRLESLEVYCHGKNVFRQRSQYMICFDLLKGGRLESAVVGDMFAGVQACTAQPPDLGLVNRGTADGRAAQVGDLVART